MVSVGQGFGTNPIVNTVQGITATNKSTSDTQVTASFAISPTSPVTGNSNVTVTNQAQNIVSNGVNFYIQVPTYFVPTNANTALNALCAANQAFYAFVDYQVRDQQTNPISAGGLTPQESVSQNGGAYSPFASFATPVSTNSDGTFEDIPLGTCFSAPPPPNRCIPVAQKFQILVPGISTPFPITTTTSRSDCEQGIKIIVNPIPTGNTYTFGIIN